MTNSQRITIFMFICLAVVLYSLLLVGCSAAKKTSKQVVDISALERQFEEKAKQDKAKYIAEYVANNPCIFPELNLDSLCGYEPITITNNDTIRVPKRVLFPYEDTRHIKLLQDSLIESKTRERESKSSIFTLKEFIPIIVKETNKNNKWKVNGWFWIALGLFIFLVLSMYLNIKKLPK